MALPALLQILAAALAGHSPSDKAPIHLVCTPLPNAVRVQLVGTNERAYEADYELEVTTDGSQSGNRTLNRGYVRLEPNVAVTLATVTLSTSDGWRARLKVKPKNAVAYEEVRSSH